MSPFVYYVLLLWTWSKLSDAIDCSSFNGQSSTIVSSYSQLSCAVEYSVPLIIVNSSFTFEGTLHIATTSSMQIAGVASSKVSLASATNYQMFNVSGSSNVAISNIDFIGSMGTSSYYDFGSVFSVSDSTLSMANVTVKGGYASLCGAAMRADRSSILLSGCQFIENISPYNDVCSLQVCAGAVALFEGSATVVNSTFSGNSGINGALSLQDVSSFSISDSTFSNNQGIGGGGLALVTSSGSLTNVVVQNNTVESYGGGINITSCGSVVINQLLCHDNSASIGGGCMCSSASKVSLIDSTLTGSFGFNGGGLFVTNGQTFTINNTVISHNTADQAAGVMVTNTSSFLAESVSISNNVAENAGGGITLVQGASGVLTNCTLNKNTVSKSPKPISFGGACYVYDSTLFVDKSMIGYSFASQGAIMFAFQSNVTVTNTTMIGSTMDSSGIFAGYHSNLLIDRCLFSKNNASLSTSCVSCLNTNTCVVQNSEFIENHSLDLGNIYIELASASILSNNFSGNTLDGSGGVVFISSRSDVTIDNCEFSSNSASIFGGAILLQLKSVLVVTSSVFVGNTAVNGGALYMFDGAQISMTDVTFTRNSASNSGGSIYAGRGCIVTGQHISITHSSSPDGGGVYCSYLSTATFRDFNASHNTAAYSGGVVSLFDYSSVTISSGNFFMNSAALGGVLSGQYKTSLYVSASTFEKNTATEHGGVAYLVVDSELYADRSYFSLNSGVLGSGVFKVQIARLNVSNSEFTSNSAANGGVTFLEGSVGNFTGNTFSTNSASSTGGVIVLQSTSQMVSIGNVFQKNQAESGGVLYTTSSSVTSTDDYFTSCKTTDVGGCVFASDINTIVFNRAVFTGNQIYQAAASVMCISEGSLIMKSCQVMNNLANEYGVVYLLGVEVDIWNTTFEYNTHGSVLSNVSNVAAGAAIYMSLVTGSSTSTTSNANNDAIISNCVFSNNDAGNGESAYGGAIYVNSYAGSIQIIGNEFVNNSAANGGAFSSTAANVEVVNNSFYGNTALFGGGAIYWVYGPKIVNVSDNINFGNNASYGHFKATNLVSINSSFVDSGIAVSGNTIPDVKVVLLDYYDQIVTNSSLLVSKETTVYSSVLFNSGTIKGQTIVDSTSGVALFTDLQVTSYPGGNSTLSFEVPISSISTTNLVVQFRECVSGEYLSKDGNQATCVYCTQGTYSFYPDEECRECPDNADCPGGNRLDLDKNYWRVDADSATILQCPVPDVCLGGVNISTQCKTGQEGPYCDVCQPGYTKSSSGYCYSCTQSQDLFVEVLSTMIFVIVLLVLCILIKYRKKIYEWYSEKVSELKSNVKYKSLRVKGKIVIAFFQILFQLGPALNIVFPINFTTYLNYYSIFQINFVDLPDLNCAVQAGFYTNLLISTISPPVLFIAVAVALQLAVIRARRLNERHPYYTQKKAQRDTIAVAFLISYFVLVSVSTTIFQVFQCETFDNGEVRLVADYSVNCHGYDYYFYRVYGSVMILFYPIGIPLSYAIILFRNRKFINPDWRLVIDGKEKVLVSDKVIQHEKIKVRKTYDQIKNISNLYDNYVPKRWYFELFDCARRLALGAIPVLIIRGSVMQIIIVLLVSLASVGVFMYFKPYIHSADNNLAIVAQWSITLVLISAMIVRVETLEGYKSSGLGAVLIFLNVMVIAFAIASAVISAKPKKTNKGERDVFKDDSESDSDSSSDEDEDQGGPEESKDGESGENAIELNPIHSKAKHIESKGKNKKTSKKNKKKSSKNKKNRSKEEDADSDDEEDPEAQAEDGYNDYDEESSDDENTTGHGQHNRNSEADSDDEH